MIDQPDRLREQLAGHRGRLALDTEFVRERTYWPQLALVQIALEDGDGLRIVLVDPLAPGMTAALAPMLADPATLKVMHSASEDLVALGHACGVVPQPLFDTQIAAALAGIGAGVGYQKLVQTITGATLDKGETRSDWLRRPLSPAQLRYAEDDVRHLFALHDALQARLHALGREAWLQEDCARLVANASSDDGERWPHLSLRAAQYLDASAQRRLLRLLRWRDAYARGADRPRGWILDNELATELAQSPPSDLGALQALLDARPKAPRKLGAQVWDALNTPVADEAQAPAHAGQDRDKRALRDMQQAVATVGAALGLPDGVLASRRWLESLLDQRSWPETLCGWRRPLLEPALSTLLSGAGGTPEASV